MANGEFEENRKRDSVVTDEQGASEPVPVVSPGSATSAASPLSTASPGPAAPANDEKREFLPLLDGFLTWTAGFWLLYQLGPSIPNIGKAGATFLSAAALVAFAIFLVKSFSHLHLHRTTYLILGLVAIGPLMMTAKPQVERTNAINRASSVPAQMVLLTAAQGGGIGPFSPWAMGSRNQVYIDISDYLEPLWPESPWNIYFLGLAQLALAAGIGLWIGNGIDELSHLIPVAVVATLADAWSVGAGATAMIVQSSQIHYFLLRFPLVAGGVSALPMLIGLTDFLFFGIFFRAAVRFGLGSGRNLLLLGSSFLVAVGGAILLKTGLPVLPFMALFFLVGNWRNLRLKREDLKTIGLFLAGIILAGLVFTLVVRPGG